MKHKWPYLCAAGIIAAISAVTVFKIPPGNILFYGALLACPLLHIFMMKNHHSGHDQKKSQK